MRPIARLSIILFVICQLGACSHQVTRGPSAQSSSCQGLLNEIFLVGKTYQRSDFPELELSFIEKSPLLQSLVDLHALEENREQSRLILGLLRERHPELSTEELARRYSALYRQC